MLLTMCSVCGRSHPVGEICSCAKLRHKRYDKTKRKASCAVYHTAEWTRVIKAVRLMAHGVDEYIYYRARRLVLLDKGQGIVHHIHPIEDAPELAFDPSNLIYVGRATHRLIHKAYDSTPREKATMQEELHRAIADRGRG